MTSSSEFKQSGVSVGGSLPGIGKFDSSLQRKFDETRKAQGKDYKPRTKHLDPSGWAKYTNRLFLESSPYLLQHAHNPVNWYPWGSEAFEKASELKRPVFLSVGYSTCHWCHVMEEESFEDEEIAKFINENYIAIKVDREERPDVDGIYMTAVQAMTGSGGWPMSVWLTPDKKPFYGGTYFPARRGDRGARVGFIDMLKELRMVYDEQPDKVAESGKQLVDAIGKMLAPNSGTTIPEAKILHQAVQAYKNRFDSSQGGLMGSPKFPSSLPIRFLLRYYRRTNDKDVLKMVNLTLEKMAAGGMYDHVGGGFHRYSTDSKWLVPHFEKMLYDNALLTIAYLEAYQVTGNKEFMRITKEILRYVKRDMTSPEGAFYSATDADSTNPKGHREEGWFFTWTPNEVDQTLDKESAILVKIFYAVSPAGNFENRNILNTPEPLSKIAKKLGLSEEGARKTIEESFEKLYLSRERRPHPGRDEKILTAWNGLMISAFAKAGLLLDEDDYIKTAGKAAEFILANLHKNGQLLRSFKDGRAKLSGYLDDYAFLIAGLIDLYEATSDIKWLNHAITLDQTLEKSFEDKASGGFFMTSADHEKLLAKEKPSYDGAEPSGNSVALLNLLKLHEFTTNDSYRKRAEKALTAFSRILQTNPVALSEMFLALDFHLDKAKEIVIVTANGKNADTDAMLSQLQKIFLPNRVLVVLDQTEITNQSEILPIIKAKLPIDGKTTAYVCKKGICEFPTIDPATFQKQISEIESLNESL